jgi:integrase
LERFIGETYGLDAPPPKASTPISIELQRYANYLFNVRGVTKGTVDAHCRYLKRFLEHIGFDEYAKALTELCSKHVESFLCQSARRLNRYTLQHVVAYLRSFLKYQFQEGILLSPLHTMIDTPRIYRFEQLPRSLPWDTVNDFLRSIDRSDAHGVRDYAMMFLIATYGLRRCEVVGLTLDDIDWRAATIWINQRKTSSPLLLPLVDAAAEVLIQYLKKSRPNLPYRNLFLRVRAPHGPLKPTAVTGVFQRCVRLSGLDIPYRGPHCLRHSYAVHLLRQGGSTKVIGDLLGHRSAESTRVYLRLAIEDLRQVALPVPSEEHIDNPAVVHPTINQRRGKGQKPSSVLTRAPSKVLRSVLADDIEDYLRLKQSLGRKYALESRALYGLDAFLVEQYPTAQELTAEIFNQWCLTLSRLTPSVRRNRMRHVRSFCLYCCRSKPHSFVPDPLTLPANHPRPIPYIFSEQEVARLIHATQYLRPGWGSPLRAETMRLAVTLLYTSGLRRGELLRLKLGDFDASQAILRIDSTKFHKSRVIPLEPSVVEEMDAYLILRRQTGLPMEITSSLIWNQYGGSEGKSYSGDALLWTWSSLCSTLNIFTREGKTPRIQDVRHSFAVNVLHRWYRNGEDVQAKLPILSTYMGHASIASTHYYLPFVEGIRSEACARFYA